MLNNFKYKISLLLFRKKYLKKNLNNYTKAGNIFDLNKVNIGNYTYGTMNIYSYGVPSENLMIGSFCSIADNVKFLLAGEHNYQNISTYPFKTKILKECKEECLCKGPITIGDDVWIGYGATILSGVTIGQGAIIGAGSIVAKDIPPYAIYANGKIIKYRFSENIIKKLLKINYSKFDEKFINNNLKLLYENINEKNIDKIMQKFNI